MIEIAANLQNISEGSQTRRFCRNENPIKWQFNKTNERTCVIETIGQVDYRQKHNVQFKQNFNEGNIMQEKKLAN